MQALTNKQPPGETEQAGITTSPPLPLQPAFTYAKLYQMTVACFNEALKTIFFFNFWDDDKDFERISEEFNKILSSVRFLA